MSEQNAWRRKFEDAAAALQRAGDAPAWLHHFLVQAHGLADELAPPAPVEWNPVDSFYPH